MSDNRSKMPKSLDDNDEKQSATASRPTTTSVTSSSSLFPPVPSLQELAITHLLTELNKNNVNLDDENLDEAFSAFLEEQKISEKSAIAKILKEKIKEAWLESDKFRELILQMKDQEDVKKVVKKLQAYKDYPYLLRELIFSKGSSHEKFGENKEFTRIHERKSAWELMIWAHNYDLLFGPLKEFVELADPTKELANSQTPPSPFELQGPHPKVTIASAAAPAAERSGKDEKKSETATAFDFESLIGAISADPCTDDKATMPVLIAKLEEFKNAYLTGLLAPQDHPNVQILQKAYKAYIDNFDPWSLNQLRVFGGGVIGPLVFSLPAGFSSHIDYYVYVRRVTGDAGGRVYCLLNLDKLCKKKTDDFSQLVSWLKNPSQTLDHNQTPAPR